MKTTRGRKSAVRLRRAGASGAWRVAVAAALLGAGPAAGSAQVGVSAGEGAIRPCGWSWRALGIGSIRCSGCTLRLEDGALVEARFSAEPEVTGVEAGVAGGDRLRPGDRLVAVDGGLIATEAGAAALKRVREGREVTLTVRRDGRTRDLRVVAGDGCAGRAVAPAPPRPLEAPTAPAGAEAPPGRRASPSRLAPAAPSPPEALPPAARLGFGFGCSECGVEEGVWFFSSPPRVTGVERSGPAWEAGIRVGDELLAVDGLSLTTRDGGERFAAIEPGQRVRWTVRRDGERLDLSMTARERSPRTPAAGPNVIRDLPGAPPPPSPSAELPASAGISATVPVLDELRYQGRLGDTDIEVRGAPVTVTVMEASGEVVIRTSDTVVRLRRAGSGG